MYKELFGIRHVWMISQTQHLHHLVSEQYEWKFYEIGFILKSENKLILWHFYAWFSINLAWIIGKWIPTIQLSTSQWAKDHSTVSLMLYKPAFSTKMTWLYERWFIKDIYDMMTDNTERWVSKSSLTSWNAFLWKWNKPNHHGCYDHMWLFLTIGLKRSDLLFQ